MIGGIKIANGTNDRIESIEAIYLIYYLKFGDASFAKLSRHWELEFERHINSYMSQSDRRLDVAYFYSQSLPDGLDQNALALIMKFTITFTILFLFVIASSFTFSCKSRSLRIDWVESWPLLAVCGLFAATLGVTSAQGLLLTLGAEYNTINLVMPFLIMGMLSFPILSDAINPQMIVP